MSFNLDNILGLVNLLRFTDNYLINNFLKEHHLKTDIYNFIIYSKDLIKDKKYRHEWIEYLQYLKD